MQGLRFVVVAIGPNDVGWTDFLRYCYGVPDCSDQLTQGEFDYRLAAFDRAYGDLLVDLNDLPGRPQVIVVTSYDAFARDADCSDTRPRATPAWTRTKIALLTARNDQLNGVLAAGAEKYGFAVARPGAASLLGRHRTARPTGSAPTSRAWPTRTRSTPPGVGSLRIGLVGGPTGQPAAAAVGRLPRIRADGFGTVVPGKVGARSEIGAQHRRCGREDRGCRSAGACAPCTASCTSTSTSSSRRSRSCAARSWPGAPSSSAGKGDPTRRGVVATASYAAREYGVRSGMPLRTAVEALPGRGVPARRQARVRGGVGAGHGGAARLRRR